jgi:hypothetical protein
LVATLAVSGVAVTVISTPKDPPEASSRKETPMSATTLNTDQQAEIDAAIARYGSSLNAVLGMSQAEMDRMDGDAFVALVHSAALRIGGCRG